MKKVSLLLFMVTLTSYLNAKTYVVDCGHKNATDKGSGTYEQPFKTISRAAELAGPGDTVLVYDGIYRERVAPSQGGTEGNPVVYRAVPGKKVIIKGSDIWMNAWDPVPGYKNIYQSEIPLEKLEKYNPFYIELKRKSGRQSLGQIFYDGERMVQVDSLPELYAMPGSWMLSYDSTSILLHYPADFTNIPFKKSLIEYSVRDKIFAPHSRGLGYITVEGFIMEHCANQFPSGFWGKNGNPQAGALSCRSGHHWVIRGNTIRLAKNLAIDCGYEGGRDLEGEQPMPPRESIGYHLIEYNTLVDNGCGGIAGASQKESVIRYNRIERNNYLGHTAPETGGIKVHWFDDGLIEGNIIRNNYCLGIWLDNACYNSRVTRNVVLNNAAHGIFVELAEGPCLVDHNIVAYNQDGIYMHDASGVSIYHNLLYVNMHYGLYARIVTERKIRRFGGNDRVVAATRDLDIRNNVFVDNYRGNICLPLDDGDRVRNNRSDYNLFINGSRWQWEGLGFNSFAVTSNDKRVPEEEMAGALEKALEESDYPGELVPNMELWQDQMLLNLEMWQALTGNDKHSFAPEIHTGNIEVGAIAKGAMNLSVGNLYFEYREGTTFSRWSCPGIDGLKKDFIGNRMDQKIVLPGPFQKFVPEGGKIYLAPGSLTRYGK